LLLDYLGGGTEVLHIVFLSALVWWAVQLLAVPFYSAVMPSYIRDVKAIARAKAKDSSEEAAIAAETETLADISVRTVAMVFSMVVSYGAVRLTLDPPPQFEQEPFAASSPFATFYCAIAAGYFVWDVVVTVYYGYGAQFLGHAVVMLMVELIALHPFNQYIMSFSHLFEISTSFMNWRHLMLVGGRQKSIFFAPVELIFGLVFMSIRILYGYTKSFLYVKDQMVGIYGQGAAIVKAKGEMFVPVAWLTVALCISLCALNGYWFWLIAQKAMGGGKVPKKLTKDS